MLRLFGIVQDQEKCLGYAGYSTVWSLACRLDDVGSVVRDVVDWEVVLNCWYV